MPRHSVIQGPTDVPHDLLVTGPLKFEVTASISQHQHLALSFNKLLFRLPAPMRIIARIFIFCSPTQLSDSIYLQYYSHHITSHHITSHLPDIILRVSLNTINIQQNIANYLISSTLHPPYLWTMVILETRSIMKLTLSKKPSLKSIVSKMTMLISIPRKSCHLQAIDY